MAVRIRNAARADFGVEPPVALLLQGASLPTSPPISSASSASPATVPRHADRVRDRARQRAAARQEAALRRKRGQRCDRETRSGRVERDRRPDTRRWFPRARIDQLGGEQDRCAGDPGTAHAPVHHAGSAPRLFWAWFVFGAVLYAGKAAADPTPNW